MDEIVFLYTHIYKGSHRTSLWDTERELRTWREKKVFKENIEKGIVENKLKRSLLYDTVHVDMPLTVAESMPILRSFTSVLVKPIHSTWLFQTKPNTPNAILNLKY